MCYNYCTAYQEGLPFTYLFKQLKGYARMLSGHSGSFNPKHKAVRNIHNAMQLPAALPLSLLLYLQQTNNVSVSTTIKRLRATLHGPMTVRYANLTSWPHRPTCTCKASSALNPYGFGIEKRQGKFLHERPLIATCGNAQTSNAFPMCLRHNQEPKTDSNK